jgi:hypothetical protein
VEIKKKMPKNSKNPQMTQKRFGDCLFEVSKRTFRDTAAWRAMPSELPEAPAANPARVF